MSLSWVLTICSAVAIIIAISLWVIDSSMSVKEVDDEIDKHFEDKL